MSSRMKPQYPGAYQGRQRRRERARLSQRAFRTRQATTLRDLREENARLRRVIKDVVEASHSGDPLALCTAIQRAGAAADLASEPHHDSTPDSAISSVATALSSGTERGRQLLGTEEADPDPGPDPHCHLGPQHANCMTFRLDSGILSWPTSPGRIVDPPVDIAPYLGPNQHTLAAHIYWYCTETSLRLIYQLAGQQPSRIASVAQNHPIFAAMLRHVFKLCSPGYLIALAEARLEFHRVGYCKSDNLAATRDSALLLRQRVEQEYCYAEGRDLDEWFTATKVAEMVRDRLRRRELSRLEAAIRNDSTDVAAKSLLEAFIHKLWLKSTCFGDGSRWKASYVCQQLDWFTQALLVD